jgi:hypothetical protein
MKAVVFHALGDIRLDDVPEPRVSRAVFFGRFEDS